MPPRHSSTYLTSSVSPHTPRIIQQLHKRTLPTSLLGTSVDQPAHLTTLLFQRRSQKTSFQLSRKSAINTQTSQKQASFTTMSSKTQTTMLSPTPRRPNIFTSNSDMLLYLKQCPKDSAQSYVYTHRCPNDKSDYTVPPPPPSSPVDFRGENWDGAVYSSQYDLRR